MTPPSSKSLYKGLGKVGFWYGFSRMIQILSMVYVTRRLDPSDFSIMAAIGAVQGVIGSFTSLNLYAELVRSPALCGKQLSVAWSYETLRNFILAGILIGAAPWIAGWFGRPETTAAYQISALGLLIASANSPRMIELRRNGQFGALGALESVSPFTYALSSIFLVIFCPNYWALVWAGLISIGVYAVATHLVCKWRPKLDFHWKSIRPLITFGLILQVNAICGALRQHGLVYVLILYGLADQLGIYNRAAAFSLGLAMQATGLVWKVAYPYFSESERSGDDSLAAAQRIQILWIGIGLPLSLVAAFGGQSLIPQILGEQWSKISVSWGLMTVAGVFLIANAPLASAFQSSRNEHSAVFLPIATTIVQTLSGLVLVRIFGLDGVGWAILLGALSGTCLSRYMATRIRTKRMPISRRVVP